MTDSVLASFVVKRLGLAETRPHNMEPATYGKCAPSQIPSGGTGENVKKEQNLAMKWFLFREFALLHARCSATVPQGQRGYAWSHKR